MTVVKICGGALTALVFSLIIRRIKPEYGTLVSGTAGVLILGLGLAALIPVMNFLGELSETGGFSEYTLILFKAVGIGLLTEITSGMCRDAGENSLAAQVGFFGRAEILLLSLPILRDVAALAAEILE